MKSDQMYAHSHNTILMLCQFHIYLTILLILCL